MRGKEGDQPIIGKFSSLWEPVHAVTNFHEDVAVVYEGSEVILGHDGGGMMVTGMRMYS
jgi:hypothetical protein